MENAEEAEDQDIQMFSDSIDKLADNGVAQADINKLKTIGIVTIKGVLMASHKDLANLKFNDQKLDKIKEAAQKSENLGFVTGTDMMLKRANLRRITTGSANLDKLLGGGIESMSITEAFGEFRSGKTQLSHTLAVTAQLAKEQGGGGGKTIFIDTENTFRPERIQAIAKRFDMDERQVLDNIYVARAYSVDHLNSLMYYAAQKMSEEQDQFALIVVDSIMAPFRVDYTGRGELSERQQVLGKTLSRLQKLSEQFNVAVYITNQVMADPGGNSAFAADPRRPVGGNIMAHMSTTRLYLKKGKGDLRVCKMYDSPMVAETEVTFQLGEGGVSDPKN